MVCAVFFAATPVFCMEAEEKPEGPFRKLPVEQKNGIFDNLFEFKDIGSCKCVSVEFYKMLEHRRRFTLTLKYYNRALPRNRRNYDNLNFSLFFADEKNLVPLGALSMLAKSRNNDGVGLAEKSLTLFLLPGDTMRFPVTFQTPLFFNGITEFHYKTKGTMLKKSELSENATLIATIQVSSNPFESKECLFLVLETQEQEAARAHNRIQKFRAMRDVQQEVREDIARTNPELAEELRLRSAHKQNAASTDPEISVSETTARLKALSTEPGENIQETKAKLTNLMAENEKNFLETTIASIELLKKQMQDARLMREQEMQKITSQLALLKEESANQSARIVVLRELAGNTEAQTKNIEQQKQAECLDQQQVIQEMTSQLALLKDRSTNNDNRILDSYDAGKKSNQ